MENELRELISLLKGRDNPAYEFFENVISDLNNEDLKEDALERLSNCFAMTQYANFTSEEEELLKNIIESI